MCVFSVRQGINFNQRDKCEEQRSERREEDVAGRGRGATGRSDGPTSGVLFAVGAASAAATAA